MSTTQTQTPAPASDPRIFKRDHTDYTVMSYLGRASNEIGEVDRVAIEMLYG